MSHHDKDKVGILPEGDLGKVTYHLELALAHMGYFNQNSSCEVCAHFRAQDGMRNISYVWTIPKRADKIVKRLRKQLLALQRMRSEHRIAEDAYTFQKERDKANG